MRWHKYPLDLKKLSKLPWCNGSAVCGLDKSNLDATTNWDFCNKKIPLHCFVLLLDAVLNQTFFFFERCINFKGQHFAQVPGSSLHSTALHFSSQEFHCSVSFISVFSITVLSLVKLHLTSMYFYPWPESKKKMFCITLETRHLCSKTRGKVPGYL